MGDEVIVHAALDDKREHQMHQGRAQTPDATAHLRGISKRAGVTVLALEAGVLLPGDSTRDQHGGVA